MREGKDLTSLAVELQRQATTKHDYLTPASHLYFNEDSEVSIQNIGNFHPNDIFSNQLATYINYPQEFYRRSQASYPNEWRNLVNTMLQNSNDKRLVRTLDGNARAFLSERYRVIDNWGVAQTALTAIRNMNEWKIESCDLTDTRLYIKVVSPLEREVKKGDIVRAGFVLSNSEIGMGGVKVEPLVYRLICKNGAIVTEYGVKKNHITRAQFGDNDSAFELFSDETRRLSDMALLAQVSDVIRASIDMAKFTLVCNKFVESMEKKITGDPVKATEVFQQQFNLRDNERVGILQHLIAGGDLNQYGLLNAVTAHSQSVENYDRATELERIGGAVLDIPDREWKSIASAS